MNLDSIGTDAYELQQCARNLLEAILEDNPEQAKNEVDEIEFYLECIKETID